MAHIDELKTALAAHEEVKQNLLDERQSKRDSLSRAAFQQYNEDTRAEQLQVTADVTEAIAAITAHLNNARQEIMVGTISETDSAGGVG